MTDDMKMEWEKAMESMNKLKDKMGDMSQEGMEDMKEEWNSLMERMNKLNDMMKEKM